MINPIITLSNGLRVANFSSPHPFKFTDGSIVPAVPAVLAQTYELEAIETITKSPDFNVQLIEISWRLTHKTRLHINAWRLEWLKRKVDVVLVPLPVMSALKAAGWGKIAIVNSPFRVIRSANRITKEIHIDKFCI